MFFYQISLIFSRNWSFTEARVTNFHQFKRRYGRLAPNFQFEQAGIFSPIIPFFCKIAEWVFGVNLGVEGTPINHRISIGTFKRKCLLAKNFVECEQLRVNLDELRLNRSILVPTQTLFCLFVFIIHSKHLLNKLLHTNLQFYLTMNYNSKLELSTFIQLWPLNEILFWTLSMALWSTHIALKTQSMRSLIIALPGASRYMFALPLKNYYRHTMEAHHIHFPIFRAWKLSDL